MSFSVLEIALVPEVRRFHIVVVVLITGLKKADSVLDAVRRIRQDIQLELVAFFVDDFQADAGTSIVCDPADCRNNEPAAVTQADFANVRIFRQGLEFTNVNHLRQPPLQYQ